MIILMENEPPGDDYIELVELTRWTQQAAGLIASTASVGPKDLSWVSFFRE